MQQNKRPPRYRVGVIIPNEGDHVVVQGQRVEPPQIFTVVDTTDGRNVVGCGRDKAMAKLVARLLNTEEHATQARIGSEGA